ncbi:uncharacterized protein LOC143863327 [Tasmannia lanceolata]|uniref:uncharacterized protein LOC143863327 n=1 Tax=Tasmannia lanceolata TaxID=3420 RepID=UPI004063B936
MCGNAEASYCILPAYADELNFISAERDVITIGSDRMKGLPRAVAEGLPGSHHFYCIHHLSANFHEKFKSEDLRKLFMNAAYSLRDGAFKDEMESIKSMSKSAEKWISEIPKRNWASAYFEGSRYNVLTTNAAESFNAILKGARSCLLQHLSNRQDGDYLTSFSTVRRQCGWTVYEVKSKYHVDEVDLEKKTCTYHLFQTMGMPCSHAIAAMGLDQRDPYSYCEEWYHADTYQRTYDGAIYPTLDRSQWSEPTHPLPSKLFRGSSSRRSSKTSGLRTNELLRNSTSEDSSEDYEVIWE